MTLAECAGLALLLGFTSTVGFWWLLDFWVAWMKSR